MNLVLLGAPGAGKGTQAEVIKQKTGMYILSTGNLLREAVKEESEIGKRVKVILDEGHLAPDDLVIDLVSNKIKSPECANGVIFDGFPRTVIQAEKLDELVKIDEAIVIDVPDEDIIDRMSQRRTCPECQATYHLKVLPPKVEGICDKCGAKLYTRSDDEPSVVKERLEVFHQKTEPIINYYGKSGRVVRIDGTQAPEDVTKDILSVVEEI